MTIYVDEPQRHDTTLRHKVWSHMVSDVGAEELHAMARRIGLKREWSQEPPKASSHHYDVTPAYRDRAIAAGAIAVTGRELAARSYDGLARRRSMAQEIASTFAVARPLAPTIDAARIVSALSMDRNSGFALPTARQHIAAPDLSAAPPAAAA